MRCGRCRWLGWSCHRLRCRRGWHRRARLLCRSLFWPMRHFWNLTRLHRLLLDILPLNLRLAAADEANRLRQRA